MTEITKEQLAVIEAAKAWLRSDSAATKTVVLVEAIDALLEPEYVPLVSIQELQDARGCSDSDGTTAAMCLAIPMALRAAADRLEEKQLRGGPEDHHGYHNPVPALREWAGEEEKLND